MLMCKFFLSCLIVLFGSYGNASLRQVAPNNITFSTLARAPLADSPALYVGAASNVRLLGVDKITKSYKLARIVQNDFDGGVATDNVLQPFVPAKAQINGQEADHPLFTDASAVIAAMTSFAGKYPFIGLAKYDAGAKLPTFGGLFLINDEKTGGSMLKAEEVNDYAGEAITAPPAALAAGEKYLFAAVSKANTQFDDLVETSRGIAVLTYKTDAPAQASADGEDSGASDQGLQQINPADPADATAKALPIDMTTKGSPVMAFGDGSGDSISHAVVGRAASMCWDEQLQHLYVGFTSVRANAADKPGGVLGCCAVRPLYKADGTLERFAAKPIVDSPSKSHFFSALSTDIFEMSNPANDFNVFNNPSTLVGIGLPIGAQVLAAPAGFGNLDQAGGGDFRASGFIVSPKDLQVCAMILNKAVAFCRVRPVRNIVGPVLWDNNATDLLDYLRTDVAGMGAGIDFNGRGADYFLPAWNGGGNQTKIFGAIYTDAARANPGNDQTLRDAIRARYVQLLKNAKIVNRAYAMGNKPNSFYKNSLDMIVGIFSDGKTWRVDETTGVVQARNDGDDDLAVSIPRLAVMHTSTGRPYLIVHSIMSTTPVAVGNALYNEADNWVYALPLIPDAINGAEYLKGTIAAVSNDAVGRIEFAARPDPDGTYQPPLGIDSMPKRFHKAVRVGGGNPVPAAWVRDLFVEGDSVYVTLAGINPSLQGVFKSTAIFDKEGRIIDWTPATRVMGSVLQTFGAMLDTKTANIHALTQNPGVGVGNKGPTTGQVTQWGKGKAVMHGGDAAFSLDAVLGSVFSANKGGVHGVVSFDELTYGFPKKQLAMLMAYGFDSVALVQMGRRKGMAFTPFTKHALATDAAKDITKNVWVFNVPEINRIGPVTCAAVVYNPGNWSRFYVGGYRGLAQLEVGYPDNAGHPNDAQFMRNIAAMAGPFVHVPNVGGQPVDSVVAVGQAVTRDLAAAGHPINARYLHAITPRSVLSEQIGAVANAQVGLPLVIDAAVLADGSIAATIDGIKFVPSAGGAVVNVTSPSLTPLQMQVVAARDRDGLFALPATIYLLGMGTRMPDDVEEEVGAAVLVNDVVPQLWRIALWKNNAGVVAADTHGIIDTYKNHKTLKGRPRPYAQLPELRLNFAVDGGLWFDLASRDRANSDFIRLAPLGSPLDDLEGFASQQAALTDLLEIDRTGNFKIGVPVRDGATGAWLLPGDWGLRVNE